MTRCAIILVCAVGLLGNLIPAPAQTIIGTVAATDSADISWQPYWRLFQERARKNGLTFKYQVTGDRDTESNILTDLRRGRVEIAALLLDSLIDTVPEFAVLSAPFLFENEQVAEYAFDVRLLPFLNEILEEKGLHALQWAEIGWVHISADRALVLPNQARGLTLRIANNIAEREFLASLGASPLALALNEIEAAIEFQADSAEKGLDGSLITVGGHYYITSDHWSSLTLTNHSYKVGLFVADKTWLETLTESQLAGIRDALSGSSQARANRRLQARNSLGFMADTGTEVITLTVPQRQAWVAAGLAAHGPILKRIGGRAQFLYDAINAAKESFLESSEASHTINSADSPENSTGSISNQL